MAKSKVAPAPSGPQAPRTVPLSSITIAWHRQPFYSGESGKIPCVITGKQLGVLLEWLSHTKHPTEKDGPGLLHYFGDPGFISMQLEGLGLVTRPSSAATLRPSSRERMPYRGPAEG